MFGCHVAIAMWHLVSVSGHWWFLWWWQPLLCVWASICARFGAFIVVWVVVDCGWHWVSHHIVSLLFVVMVVWCLYCRPLWSCHLVVCWWVRLCIGKGGRASPVYSRLGRWWYCPVYLLYVTCVSTMHMTMLWSWNPFYICPLPLWRHPCLQLLKRKKPKRTKRRCKVET